VADDDEVIAQPVRRARSRSALDRPSSRRPLHRWWIIVVTVVIVVSIDQISKWRALERLTEGDPVDLFWTLRFNLMFNTGMAFSKGSNSGPIIAVVALAIVLVLLFIARRIESKVQLVLIGVVVGGALGNLLDRLFRAESGFLSGGVVDFIDPQFWPVFNVADACVVVGGILLAITGLRQPEPDEPEER
jgi:signal peptidase II